jgi:hypothetical protein
MSESPVYPTAIHAAPEGETHTFGGTYDDPPHCRDDYRDVWRSGFRAGAARTEHDVIQHAVAHWFTQGGAEHYGDIGHPENADELIAAILSAVEKALSDPARVGSPDEGKADGSANKSSSSSLLPTLVQAHESKTTDALTRSVEPEKAPAQQHAPGDKKGL